MEPSFQKALSIIRKKSKNDKELGDIFEKIAKIFFENDPIQKQQFSKIWHYKDWAKLKKEYSQSDIGIDLVAQIKGSNRFCAIQCKCYDSKYTISKSDLDSFISASSTDDFTRLILIDTSNQDIGQNAKAVFKTLHKTYQRIQTSELEQSRIDWLAYLNEDRISLIAKKELRDHQIQAVNDVTKGFEKHNRGQMIMACGTGKTLTSLRIAEKLAGKGKLVLYMVPTLALMSQTVREWKNDCKNDFTAFSACSDIKIGKRKPTDDRIEISLTDLSFPATTNSKELALQIKKTDPKKMTVIFSTYQSLDVVSKAQIDHKLSNFDLIICDEAHRTTGATLAGDDESSFVKIHSNKNIIGKKRLYMTATPKIYGEKPKKKAEEGEVVLASMDDEKTFGPKFFYRGFNWAVENNLLTDYKVVILAIDEGKVSKNLQRSFEEGAELKLDDATKIIGCYKALAKVGFDKSNNHNKDIKPIKRALAFSQNIEISKIFKNEFKNVVDEYISNDKIESQYKTDLEVEIEHIDGTFNADLRNERLNWLKKEEIDENKCKILTNVRCLSEGVDVPTLDAILFLHPRKSQVDVVQSVGRVMRKAPGKNLGYVILPIAVAPGVSPEKAINDSERFSVVWQVLNALRAHNDRFDNTINRMKLGEDVSKQIQIINIDSELEALTTEVEDIKDKYDSKPKEDEKVIGLNQDNEENKIEDEEKQLAFEIGDLSQAIKAKIVEKCGTRDYWENWANDIAKIAKTHISRINGIVLNSKKPERKFFLRFLEEIRDDLNPEITENEAVEMLAQHIITQPVFQTLFQGNKFTQDNAISKSLEGILKKIYEQNIKKESKTLEKFYDSVKRRAKDIVTSKGRTRLINELYERFFKNAFPLTTSRLGIVYTPIEIVDFIINSAESILKKEFKSSFGNKNVNIIDPFVGTGTFITRLLQSGFIQKGDLSYKYKNEIHANEIILLAYYIAGINIESVYQDLVKTNHYQPFNKIILTDTFQLYEQERDMIANLLPDNSNRRTNQKKIDMRVIIGNPPYSIGQTSEGDNAANVSYNNLDKQIKMTYGKDSKATNQRGLYDSYIRSFRWATDRISKNNGVIGFVTGSGWIDKNFADGLRKHFVNDFTSIHIINLRGDIRKTMLSKNNDDEGENVFGQGSMTGTSITILTKNKKKVGNKIFYYDIGKNKKRKEKLYLLRRFKSIDGIGDKFKICTPDKNYDWINKGDLSFEKFIPIGEKKEKKNSIFKNYSLGIATNRDTWCYDFSKIKLKNKIKLHIDFYNSEMKRYKNVNKNIKVEDFINVDRTKIAWTRNLKKALANHKIIKFNDCDFVNSLYRPFTKQYLCYSRDLNEQVYSQHKIFPTEDYDNLVILLTGVGSRNGLSVIMSNSIPDLNFLDAGAQCFPLKLYEKQVLDEGLFAHKSKSKKDYVATSGISDEGIKYFQNHYPGKQFNKKDLFYYVYGLLHSKDYVKRFENNLLKELPRIPAVKDFKDFMIFSQSGKNLSELHLNFDKVKPYPLQINKIDFKSNNNINLKSFYRVDKMKFFGNRSIQDRSSVIYNKHITLHKIPTEAYEYIINGKSAIEWVMERQCIKKDKTTGMFNDPNDYANETMKNPAYPLELFQRVINVSLESMKIIKNLPKLKIK